jgi:hypothetical protein
VTPHIYTDTEARALLGKTGHTSWSCEPTREVMSLAVSRVLCDGRLIAEVVSEHASLVAAAPDLAATVEALHAEVARLQDRDAAYWSGYADGYGGGHTADTIRATVEALHAEVARLRALVREAYREGFAASDEMGWHSDDSASETRWLASAARAALEVTP